MTRTRILLLLAALGCCLGPAASLAQQPFPLFGLLVKQDWDFLSSPGTTWLWHLDTHVLPVVLASAPPKVAYSLLMRATGGATVNYTHGSLLISWDPSEEKVAWQKRKDAEERKDLDLKTLQCHLRFYSLLANFISDSYPEVLPPSARPPRRAQLSQPVPNHHGTRQEEGAPPADPETLHGLKELAAELERGVLPVLAFLVREQTKLALHASNALAGRLGWDWQAAFDPAMVDAFWNSSYQPCWDFLSRMRVEAVSDAHIGDVAFVLNHGSLKQSWQQYLDSYFLYSDEHAQPWTVEGNLVLVPHSVHGSQEFSTTVQWAIPLASFEDSGFVADPFNPTWERYEASAFVAAGYAWYPQIVATSPEAALGVRLWGAHLPPADQTVTFGVVFTLVHKDSETGALEPGPDDWSASCICEWPSSFSTHNACYLPEPLPLWPVLTGQLPGFVPRGELLLTVTVVVQPTCGSPCMEAGFEGQKGAAAGVGATEEAGVPGLSGSHDSDVESEEDEGCELCLGALGGIARLLSTPTLRLGYLSADSHLWGKHGFESKRLPYSSARALAAQLNEQTNLTEGQRDALNTDVFDRQSSSLPETEKLMKLVQYRSTDGWQEEECTLCAEQFYEPPITPRGHLANALVAAAVVLLPIAGYYSCQAWHGWRKRAQRRERLAQRAQQSPHGVPGQASPSHRRQHQKSPHKRQQQPPPSPNKQQQRQKPAAPQPARGAGSAPNQKMQQQAQRQGQEQKQENREDEQQQQPVPVPVPRPTEAQVDMSGTDSQPLPSQPTQLTQRSKQKRRQAKASALEEHGSTAAEAGATGGTAAGSQAPMVAAATSTHRPSAGLESKDETDAEATPSNSTAAAPVPQQPPAPSEAAPAPGLPLPPPAVVVAASVPAPAPGAFSWDALLSEFLTDSGDASSGAALEGSTDSGTGRGTAGSSSGGAVLGAAALPQPTAPAVAPSALTGMPIVLPAPVASPAATLAASPAVTTAPEPLFRSIQEIAATMLPRVPAASASPSPQAEPESAKPAAAAAGGGGADDEGEDECVVCWEAQRNTALIPCGHLVLCRRCAADLMAGAEPACPVCRQGVAFAQPIYS